MPVTLNCQVCGCEFNTFPSQVRKGRRFCSKKCKGIAQSKPINRTCETCGKQFIVSPGKMKQSTCRFCSTGCLAKWLSKSKHGIRNGSKVVTCKICSNDFWQTNSGRPKFCSRKCFRKWRSKSQIGNKNHNWQGGISTEHPPEFSKELKRQIRKRDKHTCQICEKRYAIGRRFSVHHIDYDKCNNDPSNLITLCHSCHTTTNSNRNYWYARLSKGIQHGQTEQLRLISF